MAGYWNWKKEYTRAVKDKNPLKWAQFVKLREALSEDGTRPPQYCWLVAAWKTGPSKNVRDIDPLVAEMLEAHGLPPKKGFLRLHNDLLKFQSRFRVASVSSSSPPPDATVTAAAPPASLPPEPVEPPRVYDHDSAKPMKHDEQVRWVQANMHRTEICQPDHTPNLEVWNLFVYAQGNTEEFFRNFVKPLMPTRSQLESEASAKEARELDATIRRVSLAAAVAGEKLPITIIPFRREGEDTWCCRLVDSDTAKVMESCDGFRDEDSAVVWGCRRRDEFFEAHIMPDVESITG